MKIRKVEISAFRIYDKVEDATFDFIGENSQPAPFVSLYAPNGFGKTSFYDAVEWAITNNVNRFKINERLTNELLESQRQIENGQQTKLYRNTNSSASDTFVNVYADTKTFPRELKVRWNNTSDSKGQIENEDFQKVILSQEWISAFLTEVDGVKRYERFIEFGVASQNGTN